MGLLSFPISNVYSCFQTFLTAAVMMPQILAVLCRPAGCSFLESTENALKKHLEKSLRPDLWIMYFFDLFLVGIILLLSNLYAFTNTKTAAINSSC